MASASGNPAHSAPAPAGAELRASAARVIRAVRTNGRSLTDALMALPAFPDERDRALVKELSFGTLRMLPRLEALSARLRDKPGRKADGDLDALVLIGLYQLAETRIPAHAAVASTVAAARLLGKPRATGFVNALLRRYLRERVTLDASIATAPGHDTLFPDWLQGVLSEAWPDHWPAILAASNARPPMTLRVNLMRTTRTAYAQQLAAAGLTARPVALAPAALMLDRPVPVAELPGFAEGLVSVQDAGAQLAAVLLDAQPGERVLDACAAPGGKAAHILERCGNRIALIAIDIDAERLARVGSGLARLGLTAAAIALGDASKPPRESRSAPSPGWAKQRYQRILVDAPCSATGVIRRHPDIKWLRRPTDLAALSAQQARILIALWPLLEPGGRLLYTTCSLLPDENDRQIERFLADQPDAREEPIIADWGVTCIRGRQTLPAEGGPDGFYYAALSKAAQ